MNQTEKLAVLYALIRERELRKEAISAGLATKARKLRGLQANQAEGMSRALVSQSARMAPTATTQPAAQVAREIEKVRSMPASAFGDVSGQAPQLLRRRAIHSMKRSRKDIDKAVRGGMEARYR